MWMLCCRLTSLTVETCSESHIMWMLCCRLTSFLCSHPWPAGSTNLAWLRGIGGICNSQATGGSENGRNVLRVSCVDALSKIYFFFELTPVACRFHAVAEENLVWLNGATGRCRPPLSEGSATRRPLVGAKTVETCSESHVWMLCRRFTSFLSSQQWPAGSTPSLGIFWLG